MEKNLKLLIHEINYSVSGIAPWTAVEVLMQGCNYHSCSSCFHGHKKDLVIGMNRKTRYIDIEDIIYPDTEIIQLPENLYNVLSKFAASHPDEKCIVFTGGEPFHQAQALIPLLFRLKTNGWKIVIKTCYSWREIVRLKTFDVFDARAVWSKVLLPYVDILVDQQYDWKKSLRQPNYRYSSNQRVIDVQESIKKNRVVKYRESLWKTLQQRMGNK
jgi:organic radical activating enzyme